MESEILEVKYEQIDISLLVDINFIVHSALRLFALVCETYNPYKPMCGTIQSGQKQIGCTLLFGFYDKLGAIFCYSMYARCHPPSTNVKLRLCICTW